MENKDKAEFVRELKLTIQCLSGTMHPSMELIKAYYEVLEDIALEDVVKALRKLRRERSSWVTPAEVRTAIKGRPDIDEFHKYMNRYVVASKAGEYKHPIGSEVIQRMGGSGVFRNSTIHDKTDLTLRWMRLWKEVEYERGIINAPVSEGDY